MKGDITRDSFDPARHFSRVVHQQGRVTLDADLNEQASIMLRTMRAMARDLIGPHAAPRTGAGFQITPGGPGGFTISAGRYYVDGILIENDAPCGYGAQPHWTPPADDAFAAEAQVPSGLAFLVYLDVWERYVSSVEDPSIREVALGGPDTCGRAQVVWQVRTLRVDRSAIDQDYGYGGVGLACERALHAHLDTAGAALSARLDPGPVDDNPCVIPPDGRYRGMENQLYRVEIHRGGKAGAATFKWARDNGSRLAAWTGAGEGEGVLAVEDTRGFDGGQWVELSDDAGDLGGEPGDLVRLAAVEPGALTLDPASVAGADLTWSGRGAGPRVRGWDHGRRDAADLIGGAVPVREGTAASPLWIDLEDGVQVAFGPGGTYRTGDSWLIPARVATGGLLWPTDTDGQGRERPAARPPGGIEHHYAPLGFITLGGGRQADDRDPAVYSCRCTFDPLGDCTGHASLAVGAALLSDPGVRVTEERPVVRGTLSPPRPRNRKPR